MKFCALRKYIGIKQKHNFISYPYTMQKPQCHKSQAEYSLSP